MQYYITLLLLACSIALSLFLWFRDVRRTMRERRNVVDSAYGQFMIYQKKVSQNVAIQKPLLFMTEAQKSIVRQFVFTMVFCANRGFCCRHI